MAGRQPGHPGRGDRLQSLEKVAIESAVGDYRLDILARGVEYDGNEISVCIETSTAAPTTSTSGNW